MSRKYERTCKECGEQFHAYVFNIKRGWGLFCSQKCHYAWRCHQPSRAVKAVIRRLIAGDVIPSGKPRRYQTGDGYYVLRWKISRLEYVEVLEHRFIVGLDAEHVHHKNGNKLDNRPINLEPLTASAHNGKHHIPMFDTDEASSLYRSGWSLPMLGRKYGLHPVSIMRTLKKRGVVMRPRPGFSETTAEGRLVA